MSLSQPSISNIPALKVSAAPQLSPRPVLEPLQLVQTQAVPRKVLVLADYVHPYVYRNGFPSGLPEVDLVLAAGDLPGYYLEFLATQLPAPVVYVPGNHENEYITEGDTRIAARGVINAHGRVVEVAGLRVAGWGGVPKYRESKEGQYTDFQARWGLGLLAMRARKDVDIFLTHAPPPGPHAGKDHAHRGCESIQQFMERRHPKLVVHGHIHEYEGKKFEYTDTVSGARVVNAYGYHILDF
ncbi:metallophosphoesterase family protein [Deinococcus ruber]|uniref:Phosphohydrolase n=1 Tax=Deinococcus ruber TaxID=1848197 RepID=A0A918KX65_9DEIO|nr:metallophosphoesterase [Deinococcus ruber]GGR38732.1 phosphohydrolase [Deinococcus ruber]